MIEIGALGILADRLGFNCFFMTEHHFQPEGAELSPNPLLTESAIAAHTQRIRLGQAANIVTWWHPVRIAEQAAMLDVISGGRLELGIGRSYQPREAEVFGWPLSTIQDQERNRAFYQEAYETILECWTEPSFSHRGQFFTIPPVLTRWNHQQTIAYFSMEKAGRKLEEVLKIGGPDPYGGPSPVTQSATTLRELLTTGRSIQWAAERGINAWLNRGRFKFGWDSAKRRGVVTCRYIHLVLPGQKRDEERRRFLRALELQWDYYGPFGFASVLAEADEPIWPADKKVDPEILIEEGVALFGAPAEVGEAILEVKEQCGFTSRSTRGSRPAASRARGSRRRCSASPRRSCRASVEPAAGRWRIPRSGSISPTGDALRRLAEQHSLPPAGAPAWQGCRTTAPCARHSVDAAAARCWGHGTRAPAGARGARGGAGRRVAAAGGTRGTEG